MITWETKAHAFTVELFELWWLTYLQKELWNHRAKYTKVGNKNNIYKMYDGLCKTCFIVKPDSLTSNIIATVHRTFVSYIYEKKLTFTFMTVQLNILHMKYLGACFWEKLYNGVLSRSSYVRVAEGVSCTQQTVSGLCSFFPHHSDGNESSDTFSHKRCRYRSSQFTIHENWCLDKRSADLIISTVPPRWCPGLTDVA